MRTHGKRSGRVSLLGFCLVFMVLLAGIAIGVVVSAILPLVCETSIRGLSPSSTASALIRVAMRPDSIAYDQNPVDINDYEVFKKTQLALVKSPYVLIAALRKQNISILEIVKREKDPLSWLEDALQADYVDNSEIMRVSLTSTNPQETADLVNAVVDTYIDEIVNKEEQNRRDTVAQLTQIYNSKEAEIRTKRANMIELSEQLNAPNSEAAKTQATVNIRELYDLRAALIRIQMSLGEAEATFKAAQAKLARLDKSPVSEIELQKLVKTDPVCSKQTEMIADLRNKTARQNPKDMPDDKKAEFDRLTEQLKTVEREFEIRKNELRELIKNSQRAEIEEKIAAAEVQVTVLREQKKELSARVDEQRKVSESGKAPVDIEMMSAEIAVLEKSLAEIAAQREKLNIESRARPRITVVSEATAEKK